MNLTNFEFKGRHVRVVDVNGTPYFVGKDVAECLGYRRTADAVREHCKGSVNYRLPSAGGSQSFTVIPESDVYRLTLRSKTPKAEEFQDWVCEKVLPSIRQTGQFSGRLPSRAELARMVIEQDEKLGIAGEIFDRVYPTTRYGEIGRNGLPKTGIRRAAFVAAHNRMTDAGRCYELAAQIELNLALQP